MPEAEADSHIRHMLESLHRFKTQHERLQRFGRVGVKANTQLGVDDDDTGPLLMSHSILQAVNLAADCALAAHRLCIDGERLVLHQYAHYALARSGIEGAAQGLWLLAPDDRHERVRRLLGVRRNEVQKDQSLYRSMTKVRPSDTDSERRDKDRGRNELNGRIKTHKAWIDSVARRHGIDSEHIEVPSTFAMVEFATSLTGVKAEHGSATWVVLSGLVHPSATRSNQFSQNTEKGEPREGIVSVEVTADHRTSMIAFASLDTLLARALEMLSVRMLTPDRSGAES